MWGVEAILQILCRQIIESSARASVRGSARGSARASSAGGGSWMFHRFTNATMTRNYRVEKPGLGVVSWRLVMLVTCSLLGAL